MSGPLRSKNLVSAVLIAGPTASGKSALAISLGSRLGGTVINADSMQVYRDLRVITARPTAEEEAALPHRLFGHVDAATNYSTGFWIADAIATIKAERAQGRLPILCGGTGLYFKALLRGLSDIPKVPDDIRARVRAQAEGLPPAVLHERLKALDPLTAAGLRPSDPQRILRALEVFEATGQPLKSFQEKRAAPLLDAAQCRCIFLAPERAELFHRIDRRFDMMMEAGALDEVKALAARDLDPALPAMRAHGVPGLIAYLRGLATREDAVAKGKLDTRHYAKRQFTWFRHQLPEFEWMSVEAAQELAL